MVWFSAAELGWFVISKSELVEMNTNGVQVLAEGHGLCFSVQRPAMPSCQFPTCVIKRENVRIKVRLPKGQKTDETCFCSESGEW